MKDIILNNEGLLSSLVLIGGELITLFIITFLLQLIYKMTLRTIEKASFFEKYRPYAEKIKKRGIRLLTLLWFLSSLFILGYNGILFYRKKDPLKHTLSWIESIPPDFWRTALSGGIKLFLIIILLVFLKRSLLHLLSILQQKAKGYDNIKSNDESIDTFFTRLYKMVRVGIVLLILFYASKMLFLPSIVQSLLFTGLKIYLIISMGMLFVEAATAIVDSLEALSKKYWYKEAYRDWYLRLTRLMPVFKRCLEYIIYVWAASLALLQVKMISQLATYGPALVQIIGIFFLSRVIVELMRLFINKKLGNIENVAPESQKQRQTLIPIIKTLLQYSIYFIAFLMMLRAISINPIPILAGAGVLGVVIGMGAQSLVNDILSGFFILFEGLFLVGDYVEIDSARGVVEVIHIRTTCIRDPNGQMHILRNGQINSVVNYSKEFTYAVVEVGVSYDTNLDHVYRVLESIGETIQKTDENILEPINIKGLKNFGESDLLIRTITKVKAGSHRRVEFKIREMIKTAFEKENIEIPFARRVLIFENSPNQEKSLHPKGL